MTEPSPSPSIPHPHPRREGSLAPLQSAATELEARVRELTLACRTPSAAGDIQRKSLHARLTHRIGQLRQAHALLKVARVAFAEAWGAWAALVRHYYRGGETVEVECGGVKVDSG